MKNLYNRRQAEEAAKLTGIRAERIKALVAEQLGDTDAYAERKKAMMKKKIFMTAAVAAALCATTALAVSNSESLLHYFFSGDTTSISSEVQTVNRSIEDGEYRLTVEQALFNYDTAYVLYSVEALSDKAFQPMQEDFGLFLFDHNIGFAFEDVSVGCGYLSTQVFPGNTDRKMYAASVFECPNPDGKPLHVYLDQVNHPEQYLTIPYQSNLETCELTPNAEVRFASSGSNDILLTEDNMLRSFRINRVTLSPLTLRLSFTVLSGQGSSPRGAVFFEMADGTIRSENNLLSFQSSTMDSDPQTGDVLDSGEVCYSFRQVTDLAQIRAIILGGTAYPLDGGKPYAKTVPDTMQPFLMEPVILETDGTDRDPMNVPVRALCDRIGAECYLDPKTHETTIVYQGKSYVIPIGESDVIPSGETTFGNTPVTVHASIEDGQLVADSMFELLHIGCERVNIDQHENGFGNWIVIP